MNFYSYVIYNQEHHRFYYGFCQDLKKTEIAHNQGKVEATKGLTGWVILYNEGFASKQEAIRRSRFYRTVAGQRYLKKILNF
jgi:putative endonuclease